MDRIKQAVILAAGEGQRLRPFTALKPKVMIPIANKPILQYVVEAVANCGIRNITLIVGYRKEQVIDYFGSGEHFGVEINYIEHKRQLGTAHALKQAKGTVDDKFLVLSGDNLIESNTISRIIRQEATTILVKEQENISKYGVIEVRDGTVTDIEEKPKEAISHLVNTGIYIFNEEIFDLIDQETDMTSVLRNMIELGHEIYTCEATGAWLDVVFPWDMLKLNDMALARTVPVTGGTVESGVHIKGPVSIGKGTVIRSNTYIVGPAIIGENCEIGPGACLLPSTSIGNNVCISPFSIVTNSIIADGVEIGPNSTIEDSIIDRGCLLKGHLIAQSGPTDIVIDGENHSIHIGAMFGEHCDIGGNVITLPGTIIGNRCRIRPLKVINESIPDEGLVI